MATSLPQTDRAGDAGLTLVEVLVVLALAGILTSAVSLGLGADGRGSVAREEGSLLAARMRRASEEALLMGRPVALVWTERDYRFLSLGDEGWVPHPLPLLAEVKALPSALRFRGSGAFAVTGADLPAYGAPLELRLEGDGQDLAVTWDGATATLSEPAR